MKGLALAGLLAFTANTEAHWIMGTQWEIEVPGPVPHSAVQNAFADIRQVDAMLSHYRDDSPVSRLNQEGRQEWPPEAIHLLRRCLAYTQASQGTFDLTVAPLVSLWGFKDQDFRFPAASAIAAAQSRMGVTRIHIQDHEVRLHSGTQLEFGAVGKGYALDRAVGILRQAGIRRARLNAGGQQSVIGSWQIGVQHPRDEGILGTIRLENASVATSGDYERGFFHQGRFFSHILDPRTGWPAVGYPSVTVVAPSGEHADMLSTVGTILGPEAEPLMKAYGATAAWYRDDGRVQAMADFPWVNNPTPATP